MFKNMLLNGFTPCIANVQNQSWHQVLVLREVWDETFTIWLSKDFNLKYVLIKIILKHVDIVRLPSCWELTNIDF